MDHLLESVDTPQTSSVPDIPSEVLGQPNSSESVQTDEVSSRGSESEPVEINGQPESTPLSTSPMPLRVQSTYKHLHDATLSETDVCLTITMSLMVYLDSFLSGKECSRLWTDTMTRSVVDYGLTMCSVQCIELCSQTVCLVM